MFVVKERNNKEKEIGNEDNKGKEVRSTDGNS